MAIFWSSGVATSIESPDRVTWSQRFAWGLEVEQDADRPEYQNNWFHIPIPAQASHNYFIGTRIDSFAINVRVNENARIAELHLRDGENVVVTLNVNFIDTHANRVYYLRKVPSALVSETYTGLDRTEDSFVFGGGAAGLVLAMRVEFLTGEPKGHVTFFGAGVELTLF